MVPEFVQKIFVTFYAPEISILKFFLACFKTTGHIKRAR